MVEFAELSASQEEDMGFIIERAAVMERKMMGVDTDQMSLRMDLCATMYHTPLDLEALRDADDFNFSHDVFGIRRHINRRTGELEDGFLPRFAVTESA